MIWAALSDKHKELVGIGYSYRECEEDFQNNCQFTLGLYRDVKIYLCSLNISSRNVMDYWMEETTFEPGQEKHCYEYFFKSITNIKINSVIQLSLAL